MHQFSQHSHKKKRASKGTCTLALLFAAVLFLSFISILYIIGISEISQDIVSLTTYLKSGSRIVHETTIGLKRPSLSIIEQQPSRKRLAFIITITKDGFFQDGAAVLAYSILKNTQKSDYDISFIAFVHPNVTSSRDGLTKLGYHVVEVPTPVNTSAIRFDFLREKIDRNGCCGAAELIKLNAYRLTQYDKVVHLDADTLIINPMDELYSRNFSLIYTTDPNMASHKGEDKMPVQGGFLVIQPSERDYVRLVDVLMTTEFAKGSGWNRSRIGWCWGGMTVQGLLPYYYNRVTAPNRTQVLDRCRYNSMADTPDCIVQTLDQVKSAHFTVCQKPWGCWKTYDNRLCGDFHRRWFELRREAEEFYGLPVTPSACPKGGHKHYVPMALERARFPYGSNRTLRVVPDDSKDRWDPVKEGRYRSNKFN